MKISSQASRASTSRSSRFRAAPAAALVATCAMWPLAHDAAAQATTPQPTPANPTPAANPAPAPTPAPMPATPATTPAPTDAAPAQPGALEQPAPVVAPAPAPEPAKPADAPTAKAVEWTSLRLLKDKGVITEDEYNSAMKDLGVQNAGDAATLMVGKLKTTFYGFVQADYTWNSTQSCQEFCGNAVIQKEGSYRGDHSRMNFSPRDSRFGFRIAAPEERKIRVSGTLEMDFFGPTTTSEQGTWVNPVLRVRHAFLKMETPIVDVLLGQTWSPLGWSAGYLVTSVQEPGLPGQLFQRSPQLRLSKLIKGDAVNVELMAAAVRPPQADSGTPEGTVGARLLFNKWTGQHTAYMTATTINPASIGITADARRFRISEFAAAPQDSHIRVGGAVAVDAYLPIIKATKESKDNALAVTAEFAYGKGTSDMYTALGAAGTASATAIPVAGGPAATYVPNFDPGLAAYTATGKLDLIQWTSYMVGAEFYPAAAGNRLGLFVNYGHMESDNSDEFGGALARKSEDFYNGGLFFDPTKVTRLCADFAVYDDHHVDGTDSQNLSVMTTAFLFF